MGLTKENIDALVSFVNMPEDDYNELKTASPLVTSTVDQIRKLLA